MDANRMCDNFDHIRTALGSDEGRKRYKDYAVQDGLLVFRGRLCVPVDSPLVTKLLTEVHALPASGHPGARRTLALLRSAYYWPKMRDTVERYVRNCRPCNRIKHPRDKYNGLLKPLPIPLSSDAFGIEKPLSIFSIRIENIDSSIKGFSILRILRKSKCKQTRYPGEA